jgi:hypothetical protein
VSYVAGCLITQTGDVSAAETVAGLVLVLFNSYCFKNDLFLAVPLSPFGGCYYRLYTVGPKTALISSGSAPSGD